VKFYQMILNNLNRKILYRNIRLI